MAIHDHSDSGVGMGMVLGILMAIVLAVLVLFFVLGSNVFGGRSAGVALPAQPAAPAAPAEPVKPSGGDVSLNPTINVNPPAQSPSR